MLENKVLTLPVAEVRNTILNGELTCVELIRIFLDQIESTRALNAFTQVYSEEALAAASRIDEKIAQNDRLGKLWAVVISIKDVISYRDHQTTAGSRILQSYRPVFSATAVERLLQEDAIIIGSTNCDEFAMGSDNRNSFYGPVHNAIDPDLVPGGSSGGAAVSVQSFASHIGLGSDTGGSVRQPASFCNLIGYKPSYGRISRHGLIAYASSFDQIGLIGRHLHDVERVYQVISGPDEWDSTTLPTQEVEEWEDPPQLAYISETLQYQGLQPRIKDAFLQKIERLEKEGWNIEAVSLPLLDYVIPSYYVLTSAEASSNLSRYDGIRYGFRSPSAKSLQEMYTKTRTEGFGDEVKRRILLGTFVLSVGYYDAFFAKAQQVRRLLTNEFDHWFQKYDGIILPTTPTTAWSQDQSLTPVEMYLSDIYSVLANLIGAPAISIPLGADDQSKPFGIQILGKRGDDGKVLTISKKLLGLTDR